MKESKSLSMQFLFGDRELLLTVHDLLDVPVEVIVSPANKELANKPGLVDKIQQHAGERFREECAQFIREHGNIDSGMSVYTGAGDLHYQAIIHAVGPEWGEGDEQHKLEQAVSRSLLLCEMNEWRSIAFPAIGTDRRKIPMDICAQAFYRAITHFWDARQECVLSKVVVCLTQRNFRTFFDAFREQGITVDKTSAAVNTSTEEAVGYVDLSEQDIADLDQSEIDEWFK